MSPHLVDVTMFWCARGGGVGRYLHTKQRWLRAYGGWRHTIAVPGAVAGRVTEGVQALRAAPLPGSGGYRFPLQRAESARAIAALAPTLIEAGDPYRLAWAALDAGQQQGVPVIAFCHSDLVALAGRLARPWGDAATRWAQRAAARYLRHTYAGMQRVLAPSHWIAGRLRELGIERVAHQPLGVDTRLYRPAPVDRAWRAQLGLPPQARVLLYAGRFAPEKNLDVLVGAVERLRGPYVLLLVGAGPTRPPASSRVRVLPYLRSEPLLARVLASADAFVHAGDQETCGLVALEAFACGTPVVARAAAGLAELLDTPAAVGAHRARADAFATAIDALFERDHDALRAAARVHALRHDWQHAFSRLVRTYAELHGITPAAPRRVAVPQ